MTPAIPPFAIIKITCCFNCAYTVAKCDWCTLNDDVTIPDGYCIGYESEEGLVDVK